MGGLASYQMGFGFLTDASLGKAFVGVADGRFGKYASLYVEEGVVSGFVTEEHGLKIFIMFFHIDGFLHLLGFDGEVPETGEHLLLFFGGAGVGRVEPVDFGDIGHPCIEVLAPEEVGIGLHEHEAPGKAEVEQADLVAIVEDVVAIPTSGVLWVVFHLVIWGINVIFVSFNVRCKPVD